MKRKEEAITELIAVDWNCHRIKVRWTFALRLKSRIPEVAGDKFGLRVTVKLTSWKIRWKHEASNYCFVWHEVMGFKSLPNMGKSRFFTKINFSLQKNVPFQSNEWRPLTNSWLIRRTRLCQKHSDTAYNLDKALFETSWIAKPSV